MHTRTLIPLVGIVVLICGLACPAPAQQTEKRIEDELLPIREPEEKPTTLFGEMFDVSTTIELGGQVAHIRGNNDVYRSQLNYADGFRLFSFQTRGEGREGAWMDDFYLQMGGWGGDPQNWARFGASKDKWFDFKGHYRRQDYFWLFPGFARSQHINDQQRRLQSYDLKIFPGRPLRFRLGYTRNSSFGVAFTTGDVEGTRDIFLLLQPVRNTYDEYRAGVEFTWQRWNFFFEQGYRFFRNEMFLELPEDCQSSIALACLIAGDVSFGNIAGDAAFAGDVDRAQPIRNRIDFTRVMAVGRPLDNVETTLRLVHSDIDTDAARFEDVVATSFTGTNFNNIFQTLVEADRPYTTVDLSATWRPFRQLTISDHFEFRQWNLQGGGLFDLFEFFPLLGTTAQETAIEQRQLNFEGYRNRFEGRYDFNRYLSLRGGFAYEHRDVELVEWEFECAAVGSFILNPFCADVISADMEQERIDLNTRTFLMGVIARPLPSVTVFFDLERGNATGVFTRVSANNVDRIRVRGRWEPAEGVRLFASWFVFDNTNTELPVTLFGLEEPGQHSTRNRGVSLDFQFFRPRYYVNAGYSRNDITAQTDVAFFFFFTPQIDRTTYIANDNYAYIDFGGRLIENLYGDIGYRVVFTTGTFPPSNPVSACPLDQGCSDPILAPLIVNPFDWGGLNYHQPHVSLRYAFNDTLSWKAGWRWYGYNQKLGTISDYTAHIITTSAVLTF